MPTPYARHAQRRRRHPVAVAVLVGVVGLGAVCCFGLGVLIAVAETGGFA